MTTYRKSGIVSDLINIAMVITVITMIGTVAVH